MSFFTRMKEFVDEYYIEPEKMTVPSAQFETKARMAEDDLGYYEQENTVELEQQSHPSDTGEDNIIVIEE